MRWLLLLVLSITTACAQISSDTARDHLNAGVQAYRASHYDIAIAEFKRAAELDPALPVARLYLATAYAQSYVPGLDNRDNNYNAEQAIENFIYVIASNLFRGSKIACLKGIASILFNQAAALDSAKDFEAAAAKLNQAKEYQQKVVAEQPDDAEAHYSIGVIDWTLAYKPRQELRTRLGLDNIQPLDDASCSELRAPIRAPSRMGFQSLLKQ